MLRELKQHSDTFTCVGRLICPEGHVSSLNKSNPIQGAITAWVGLTRATVNRILKRHAAMGSLVPGKSSGTPTPWQDRALLRMV